MIDLRYPIGKFKMEENITDEKRKHFINEIEEAPANLRKAVEGLTQEQFDTPYREGGWAIRQVVHHLPDSHLNSYIRFKLALTEEQPLIKTYYENKWAELYDAKTAPIEVSLMLLEALHSRWVMLLKSLKPEDFKRTVNHPELGVVNLDYFLCLYAWHGKHHTAHITSLRERMKW